MSDSALTPAQGFAATAAWLSVPLSGVGWLVAVLGAFLAPAGLAATSKPVFGDGMAGIAYVLAMYVGAGGVVVGLLCVAGGAGLAWVARASVPQSLAIQRKAAVAGAVLLVLAGLLGVLAGWLG